MADASLGIGLFGSGLILFIWWLAKLSKKEGQTNLCSLPRAETNDYSQKLVELEKNEYWRLRNAFDRIHNAVKTPIKSQFGIEQNTLGKWKYDDLKTDELAVDQVASIFKKENLEAPLALDLIKVECQKFLDLPSVPKFINKTSLATACIKAQQEAELYNQQIEDTFSKDKEISQAILARYEEGDAESILQVAQFSLLRHSLWEIMAKPYELYFDEKSKILLCEIQVPDLSSITLVNKRGSTYKAKWLPIPKTQQEKIKRQCIHALCIRAAYLIAHSDEGGYLDLVTVNANQHWFDKGTGKPKEGIVATLQAKRDDLRELDPNRVDPSVCFNHFKGLTVPTFEVHTTPLRPIFTMNKSDNRIVESKDVVSAIQSEENLASMPWEDFEHLVRQLFELEFGNNGVDVRVTRASRDRGVDAIMYDPDPVRGGTYVLQAKRYTRPVDVAAVRDLYGTVMNEGANRGILVTTSSYGPDSYEFAKGKPISLIDGPNLIAMLKKHGKSFRINLAEARKLLLAQGEL